MAKPTNYDHFESTLQQPEPNPEWPESLKSLWYDAKGDWESSHNIAQDLHTETGSWIHAYLHRKEGDEFNAGYWYRRANRDFPTISLNEEHRVITESTLKG